MSKTLLERLSESSTIKEGALIRKSKVFGNKEQVQTDIPMINVALSGDMEGGLTPGLTIMAGPSRHFKTAFSLIMAAAYQKKYPDAYIVFYDSEFGAPEAYWENFGVDMDRVWHVPITDIEVLKFDIVKKLQALNKGDHVCFVIDSIGNLASKKEIDDAIDMKSVADMTRAKAFKSLWRCITPHLSLKDFPVIAVNHTYKEIGPLYPKDVIAGGQGTVLAANTIWILGRQQEKDGKEISGYHFIINVDKSRFVREKSKIPITCTWEEGVNKWSGLLDIALIGKYIIKPNVGWYQRTDKKGEPMGDKLRAKDIQNNGAFWEKMFKETDIKDYIKRQYQIGLSSGVVEDADVDVDVDQDEAIE